MRLALAIAAFLLAHSLLVGERDTGSVTLGLVFVMVAGVLFGLEFGRNFSRD